MQTYNVSEELNRTFGVPGSESRKEAENQAWEENTMPKFYLMPVRKQV